MFTSNMCEVAKQEIVHKRLDPLKPKCKRYGRNEGEKEEPSTSQADEDINSTLLEQDTKRREETNPSQEIRSLKTHVQEVRQQ